MHNPRPEVAITGPAFQQDWWRTNSVPTVDSDDTELPNNSDWQN
jgi:hypothetical protein